MSYTPYQVKAVALKERKNGQQDTNFRYIPFCLEGVKKLNENSSPLSLNIPSGSRTLFLLHSADLPSGVKAADLELADSSGRKTIMPITVGRETGSLKTQTLPARAFCFEEGIPDECGFFYVTAFELPEDVERAGIIAAGNYLFAGAACSRQRIPLRSENGDYMLKAGQGLAPDRKPSGCHSGVRSGFQFIRGRCSCGEIRTHHCQRRPFPIFRSPRRSCSFLWCESLLFFLLPLQGTG